MIYTRIFTIVSISLALCGCAALNSIYRTSSSPSVGHGRVITVDAKQRHTLIMPEVDSQTAGTKWRVCAEAAPDVFSALASSFSAQGNKSGGQLSIANAETAATIERTQTINMLRESFYRTCERYASGAISRTQFVIQAARDQNSMVAVLAIEQLTGALRPKSTLISGPGTSASVLSSAEANRLVRDLQQNLKEAQKKRDEADQAVRAAAADFCSSVPEKSNPAVCESLKKSAVTAQKDADTAESSAKQGMDLAKNLADAALSSTSTGSNIQGGGVGTSDITVTNLTKVADTVARIQAQSAIDEPLMFCIGYLSDPDATSLGKHVSKLAKGGKPAQNSSDISENVRRSEDTDLRIVESCLVMLSDRQTSDNKIKLFNVTLSPEQKATTNRMISNYDSFKEIMIRNINSTQELDWNNLWARFAKIAVIRPEFCTSRNQCLKRFEVGMFSGDFTHGSEAEAQLMAAAADWKSALEAMGIRP